MRSSPERSSCRALAETRDRRRSDGIGRSRHYPVDPVTTDDSLTSAPASRRRPPSARRIGAVAVLAALALGACSSDPGPKRVAQDIIKAEALANPELNEECMLEALDGYENEALEAIAGDLESSNAETQAAGESALADFQADLDACNN